MSPRAYAAIVAARLRALRRPIAYACAAALPAGLLETADPAPPFAFCALLGIVFALTQTPGRYPHLDSCEQSAPLFGRELARGRAIVPSVAVAIPTALYFAAQIAKGAANAGFALVAIESAVVTTTLVALSATIRFGPSRALYVAAACCVAVLAYLGAFVLHSLAAELTFCAIVSFFALRQYGEALARFDPV